MNRSSTVIQNQVENVRLSFAEEAARLDWIVNGVE